MALDTVLYAFVGAYIEAVLPTQEFGVPRPWYFPLTDAWALICWVVAKLAGLCGRGYAEVASAPAVLDAVSTNANRVRRRRRRPEPYTARWFLSFLGLGASTAEGSAGLLDADNDEELADKTAAARRHFQPLDSSLQAKLREGRCVSVRGLRKEFSTDKGVKVAVECVRVNALCRPLPESIVNVLSFPSVALMWICSRARSLCYSV